MRRANRHAITAVVVLIAMALVFVMLRYWRPAPLPPVCGVHCGTERWTVKTLTDKDASCVNFSPKETTISWLASQEPPAYLPDDNRVSNLECHVWEVKGRLIAFKSEDDGDYHLVIQDLQADATMIAEIPNTDCGGACSSLQRSQFERVRKDFSVTFGAPPTKLHRLSQPPIVTITGVGFFDRFHRQTGVAQNGVELHPMLSMASVH